MKSLAPLPLLLALAACAPGPTPPASPVLPPPDPAEDTCQSRPFQSLLGQPATALERELILRPVRVIRPDMVVTADFRPDRLNFEVGESGDITRIYCG